MPAKLDDTQYWLKRHVSKGSTLASVGQKSYSDKANYYMYLPVRERYAALLDQLAFPPGRVRVLDAGGGQGIFLDMFLERGYDVTLADISPTAIESIKARYGAAVTARACDLSDIPVDQPYDIVHCFDVLYHILDDEKWAKILETFSRISSRYIILHERFFSRRPILVSQHIRFRPYSTTTKNLISLGFRETKSIPTRFWMGRILTYRLSPLAPELFYRLDRRTLDLLEQWGLNQWGSYQIKVFERD